MPISVSRGHFALRYEVPKFLPRGGHLCMAVLTIAVAYSHTVAYSTKSTVAYSTAVPTRAYSKRSLARNYTFYGGLRVYMYRE